MAKRDKIVAEIDKILSVEIRTINGQEMFGVSQLEKAFDRYFDDWITQRSAREFIEALAFVKHLQNNERLDNMNVGQICGNMAFRYDGSIWLCREVFIEFARWLSPYFAVQCDMYYSPLTPRQNK